ncbi:MAG: hypothetical protein GXY76_08035 [Chloroflexi bacterium]|nr:hypothetical protein [Chloroflexota bacterium]
MTIHKLDDLLAAYGGDYLVVDFNHLFISSTLREEAWLLRQGDDPALIARVVEQAQSFGIHNAAADRELGTYSGGEQAILACLLLLAATEAKGLCGVRVLLYNVLDSLSGDNRRALVARFLAARDRLSLYRNEPSAAAEAALVAVEG